MIEGTGVSGKLLPVSKDAESKFDKIGRAADELKKALEELPEGPKFDDPWMSLPFTWSKFEHDGDGGPAVLNPLVIKVGINLEYDDEDVAAWHFDFDELVGTVIEGVIHRDGTISTDSHEGTIKPLADALQALVDELRALPVSD